MKAVTKLPTPVSSVKSIKQKAVQSIALSLLAVSVAQANETVSSDDIIVTANRTATTADQTLASVTVITREDIERSQVRSTEELLRKRANLTVKNDGGRGKNTSLFIRGTESNHVLVLIDGVKVGNANFGTTPWQHIPVAQIDRVEIVKGSRSSLYGSEALGGVIQIFTRKGEGSAFNPVASVGVGSDETYEAGVGANGSIKDTSYSFHWRGEKSDGFDTTNATETDDDGYENYSFSMNVSHQLNANNSLSLNFLRADNEVEFDGWYNGSEGYNQVVGAGLTSQLTDKWQTQLTVGQSIDSLRSFLSSGGSPSKVKTKRDNASWTNQYDVNDALIALVGIDYTDDKLDSTTEYSKESRDNYGYFGQLQGHIHEHDYEVSVRLDDNEDYGSETTGAVAWGYSFVAGTRIFASYSSAFSAPTFNDVYAPSFWGSNPDLKPEESKSAEVGLSGNIENVNWKVNWFQTHIDNLIQWVPDFPGAWTGRSENVAKSRIKGIELSVDTVFFDWVMRADLSLIDPENREEGNDLIYRPSQVAAFNMDRDFGKLSTGLTLTAQSEVFTDSANTDQLPGFATVDIRAGYQVTDALKVQAKIDNLFDKDYETSKGYNQPDMTYFVSLVYQP